MLPQDQYLQASEGSRTGQREVLSNNAQAKASSDPTGGLELDAFVELSCLEAKVRSCDTLVLISLCIQEEFDLR